MLSLYHHVMHELPGSVAAGAIKQDLPGASRLSSQRSSIYVVARPGRLDCVEQDYLSYVNSK